VVKNLTRKITLNLTENLITRGKRVIGAKFPFILHSGEPHLSITIYTRGRGEVVPVLVFRNCVFETSKTMQAGKRPFSFTRCLVNHTGTQAGRGYEDRA